MRDDFKYKALMTKLKQNGVSDVDYYLLLNPNLRYPVDTLLKFKFKDYVFFSLALIHKAHMRTNALC